MEGKHWSVYGMALVAAVWLALAVAAWCRPETKYSTAERRELASFPELSAEKFLDGSFASDFESYTLDQFPFREGFRQLKARFHYGVLCQLENNGIYLARDHAAKLEYPLNEESLSHSLAVFQRIYDRYLQNCRVFTAVVPDKGYYLAQQLGYPVMDYDALFEQIAKGMPYASYVNLTDSLSIDDYYRTDTHWRQDKLLPTAKVLCDALGIPTLGELTAKEAENPFYGVYYGQAALPMEPDTLYTMENAILEQCRVYNYETGRYGEIYDASKLEGEDLYEVFLSGSVSLLRIENPNASTDRELIVFRDSFGSAMAPLLVQGYKTVTLVDIRYISSAMLGRFVDFQDQDVLFLYSTLVLNNSSALQ